MNIIPSIPNESESYITMPNWRLCIDRSIYFILFSCLFCVTMPNQWSFFFSSNHLTKTTHTHTHTTTVRTLYLSYYSSLLIRLKSIKSISNNTQTTDSVRFTLFYLRSSFALNFHEYGPMERSRSSSEKMQPISFFSFVGFSLSHPQHFEMMASAMTVAMNFLRLL